MPKDKRTALNKLASNRAFSADTIISRAPGRINLIGEHTDYNHGLVLPASINRYLYVALNPSQEKTITAYAIDKNEEVTIPIDQLEKTGVTWADYLIGLLREFRSLGHEILPFSCAITSEIPIGSGLSSSAAYDCAFITALNAYYHAQLDKWDIVNLSNRSNNNFLGIKSGILDQFASVFGKSEHALYLDCDTRAYQSIPIRSEDYTWLLINTCVKHDHLTSGYNDRVNECHSALLSIQKDYPDIEHLSQVESIESLSSVRFENENCRDRALFICSENQRVKSFINALNENALESCGQLLYASHDGLSNQYEVSCDELDFLVDLLREDRHVLGSRMMGGGFGGCTLNLVKKDQLLSIKSKVSSAYSNQFDIEAEFIDVTIADGAQIIKL